MLAFAASIVCAAAPAGSLHQVAERAFTQRHAAGMVVGVRRGERTLLLEGFGFANLEHQVKAGPETVFHFDSITKQLVTVAVLRLTERGKLSLDDDVHKWVPELPKSSPPLTVRALLNHTSGLASFDTLPSFIAQERLDVGPKDLLAWIDAAPRTFAAGSSWRYTNSGFYLAGLVLERASGQSLESLLRAQLFEPAGMTQALLDVDATRVVLHRADGYGRGKDGFIRAPAISWVPVSSAGAISGTARDLLSFAASLEAGKLLNAESREAMGKPTRLSDGSEVDYGLGSSLGRLEGHRLIGHTGTGAGFTNVLLRLPDDGVTVVVLSNTDDVEVVSVATALARAALGLPDPAAEVEKPLTAQAPSCVGIYDSSDEVIEVSLDSGKLMFKPVGAPIAPLPMTHLGDDLYSVGAGATVKFTVSGKSVSATLRKDGFFRSYSRKK